MATGGFSDIERGTDETFDFLCSVCKGKNKNTEAKKFCSDCNDYYCSVCVKCHSDVQALNNHKILDAAPFQLQSSVKLSAVPIERCKIQKHKPLDMYCKTHDVVACSRCMLFNHSACKDKLYISDFIKDSSNLPDSTDIADQLDTIAKQLNVLLKTFISEKEKLKCTKENSLKQIHKFRKEINHCLDQLEKSTVEKLDQRCQFVHDKIECAIKEIQALTNEIKVSQDGLKSTAGNNAQRFISVKTAQVVAGHAKVKTDTITSQVSSAEISFEAKQKLNSLLNDMQILGDITLTDKPLSKPTSNDLVQQVGNRQTGKKTDKSQTSPSLLQTNDRKKCNVRAKSDKKTCDILGACILDDGTIILSDYANIKLKRVDPEIFIVRDCCDVPEFPHQVCAISNTEVAVCCPKSNIIQFVAVEKTMNTTRQINTGYCCYGLGFVYGKLFVSDNNIVYVHNVSGDKLQQFVLVESGKGQLAVTDSNENLKIYVTSKLNGLFIRGRHGLSIGQFNGPELKGAFGVCLLKNGDVLASGYHSNNILQFSHDGKLIGEVVKSNKHCQAICCDKNNSTLVVGFNTDKIVVYDISGRVSEISKSQSDKIGYSRSQLPPLPTVDSALSNVPDGILSRRLYPTTSQHMSFRALDRNSFFF